MNTLNKYYRKEFSNNLSYCIEEKAEDILKCWPTNAVTNTQYDSDTQLFLALIAVQHGYNDPRWCTKEQCLASGWSLKQNVVSQRIDSFNGYDLQEERNLTKEELQERLANPEKRGQIKISGGTCQVINAQYIDGIPTLEKTERDINAISAEIEAVANRYGIDFNLADKAKLSEIGQLHRNAGYYILAESKGKALGFSPTAPSSIVIWDRTPDGYYANGHYGNTLNLFEIADLRFLGMNIDSALSKLESIGFDWREEQSEQTHEYSETTLENEQRNSIRLEVIQPLLDEIEEYENDFDIPPLLQDGKSTEEVVDYIVSIKQTIENNQLKNYDEPFYPSQEDGKYTVSVHNAFTNETEVIGYDNERSYTFAIDEYKAFMQADAILPQLEVTATPTITHSTMANSVVEFVKQKLIELDIQDIQIIDAVEYNGGGEFGANVLIEYNGNIREDDFFNILHDGDFTVGGKKIDINPITATKSGTIKQYLESLRDNEDGQQPNRQTSTNRPSVSLRTKQETIDYFKHLSYRFGVVAHRNNDSMAQAKSEAYELAAFELDRNMVGDVNLEKQHLIKPTERNDKPVVYVCSPLAGEIEANIRKAREYSKFVAKEGNIPIAPHITELFNDTIPEERELGLSLGIDYLYRADELWVFGDHISNGMAMEIKLATEELHIPIYSIDETTFQKSKFVSTETKENKNIMSSATPLSLSEKLSASKQLADSLNKPTEQKVNKDLQK